MKVGKGILHPMKDRLLRMRTCMEDSPTDTPEFWMTDRNDTDTHFVRGKGDVIPDKKHP
jgi:hypothetical protein